jgi:hypothetical protein
MRMLTLPELLKVTGTTEQGLKSLRRRNQLAGAFSLKELFNGLPYLPLDAVGMLLAGTLAKPYSQTEASQLVRLFGDTWAETVSEAEANFSEDAHFCIVDFERESDGKKAHMACGARKATPEQIAAALRMTPEATGFVPVRVNCVNVSHLIRFIRKTAAKHGIDLIAPFMPPPGSKEFKALFAPYVELRDKAIVAVRDHRMRGAFARLAGEKARKVAEEVHRCKLQSRSHS